MGTLIAGKVDGGTFPAKKIERSKATLRIMFFAWKAANAYILTLHELISEKKKIVLEFA